MIMRPQLIMLLVAVSIVGCRIARKKNSEVTHRPIQMETLLTEPVQLESDESLAFGQVTLGNIDLIPTNYRKITLDDAISIAFANPQVLRSLGATSISSGTQSTTNFEPAIDSTNPNFGVSAALAEFDGTFSANTFFQKNDDVFNNRFLGAGAQEVREDVSTSSLNWNRVNRNGTQLSYVAQLEHRDSDATNLEFPSIFRTVSEFSVRHPLLQGNGVRFNNIAGPNSRPGFLNTRGLIISKLNNAITQGQFEQRVRDMAQEIATAYWRLDLAYRSYESNRELKEAVEKTLRSAKTKQEAELVGGEVDRVAQAEEQFFQFEVLTERSLRGNQRTGQLGVYQAEANLRRLLNLPLNDGQLLKPSDERMSGGVVYDPDSLYANAIQSRVELRQQRLRVRQRELELEASKNFLLPRLDAVATYRNNGFGPNLAGGTARFSSALTDAVSNDHGEWELGLTYDVAVGRRLAKTGIRNAELGLQRERAILRDQQQQLAHDLASSLREIELNYNEIQLNEMRLAAAQRTLEARQVAYEADKVGFDELLEAQRRLLESKLEFDEVRANYEIAKEGLMLVSGDLLQQHGVVIEQPANYDDPVMVAQVAELPLEENTLPNAFWLQ